MVIFNQYYALKVHIRIEPWVPLPSIRREPFFSFISDTIHRPYNVKLIAVIIFRIFFYLINFSFLIDAVMTLTTMWQCLILNILPQVP